MRKGIGIFTILLIAIIAGTTISLFFTIPVFLFKYHLTINLKIQYDFNEGETAILSLLRLPYQNQEAYRIFSEWSIKYSGDEKAKEFLKEKINITSLSKCYKLLNSTNVLLKSDGCDPKEVVAEAYIFVPYNSKSLVEKYVLVYDR
ncbi:MAG: hypothetical protein QXL86_02190 [Candidatus Aenigmatarchaeota archaeon]